MTKRNQKTGSGALNVDRRSFLRLGAATTAGASLLAGAEPPAEAARSERMSRRRNGPSFPHPELEEVTIQGLMDAMASGQTTAVDLVNAYTARIEAIDRSGPTINSIIELNPDAVAIARQLDQERSVGRLRGPLHGIPMVLKDNIDTGDQMQTTAGSLALVGPPAPQDATVTRKLREAGAIIFAKTNLSEWANFRGSRSVSGWSGRGRQTKNPYVTDRSPCGSSSGSAAAVSGNLCAAALGTETNGSLVCPASVNGVVAIKPSVGLTSRAGVIPISDAQDTVGPLCRSVADAARVLGAITGADMRDPATGQSVGHSFTDYTQFLDADGLRGARIGIARQFFAASEHIDRIVEPLIEAMRVLGAVIVDPANFANLPAINNAPSLVVLEYEFKDGINRYLASRPDLSVHTLQDLIDYNNANADAEMPYFLQQLFIESQARGPLTDMAYRDALALDRRVSREEGIDEVMNRLQLDALFAPTRNPAWTIDLINGDRSFGASSSPAALAGYPLVSLTAGYAFEELPVGATFMGRRWSEPTLIKLAFALEQAIMVRKAPRFLDTLELP